MQEIIIEIHWIVMYVLKHVTASTEILDSQLEGTMFSLFLWWLLISVVSEIISFQDMVNMDLLLFNMIIRKFKKLYTGYVFYILIYFVPWSQCWVLAAAWTSPDNFLEKIFRSVLPLLASKGWGRGTERETETDWSKVTPFTLSLKQDKNSWPLSLVSTWNWS